VSRARARQIELEAERSAQREGDCAGKSLREMLEAELQRVLIAFMREKEEGSDDDSEKYDILRGEIKAYSHSILIIVAPYERGSEKARKRIVSENMAKAKHIKEYMGKRPVVQRKLAHARADITGAAESIKSYGEKVDLQIENLNDMISGLGIHSTHTQKQIGRCVVCSCGDRAQGRMPR
jgi:hypothetical protein